MSQFSIAFLLSFLKCKKLDAVFFIFFIFYPVASCFFLRFGF